MASREDAADYLASLSTDELINFVAENLTTPRRPDDPSAGKGGEREPPNSVADVIAARRAARAAKR